MVECNVKENLIIFLKNKNILLTDECCICYEKFINIRFVKLFEMFDNKLLVNICETDEDVFSLANMCIDERFYCIVCKNKICLTCFDQMPARIEDEYNHKNGCEYTMSMTKIVTCPICNTKDYRLKYHPQRGLMAGSMFPNLFPEELLSDIKNK